MPQSPKPHLDPEADDAQSHSHNHTFLNSAERHSIDHDREVSFEIDEPRVSIGKGAMRSSKHKDVKFGRHKGSGSFRLGRGRPGSRANCLVQAGSHFGDDDSGNRGEDEDDPRGDGYKHNYLAYNKNINREINRLKRREGKEQESDSPQVPVPFVNLKYPANNQQFEDE